MPPALDHFLCLVISESCSLSKYWVSALWFCLNTTSSANLNSPHLALFIKLKFSSKLLAEWYSDVHSNMGQFWNGCTVLPNKCGNRTFVHQIPLSLWFKSFQLFWVFSFINLIFLHFGPSVFLRVFFLSLLFIFHLLSNIYCFKSHVASSVGKHNFFIKTFWEKKSGNAFMRARNQPTLSVS